MKEYVENGFPVTIIRPGHTYDTLIPEAVGNGDWTNAKRIKEGKPIVVHGDGTNVWTITHGRDMSNAMEALLGNEKASGEAYHITDNSKIKSIANGWSAQIDAERGINESIKWLQGNTERQRVNNNLDDVLDKLSKK